MANQAGADHLLQYCIPEMEGNIVYVDYGRSSWRYMNYERNLPKEDLDCYKIGGAFRQEYDIMEPYRIGKVGR